MQQHDTLAASQDAARRTTAMRAALAAPGLWLGCDTLFANLRTLAGINFDFALWSLAGASHDAFDETGLMENLQAALLAAAVAVLVRIAIVNRGAARTAAIGFAFVCFAVMFREVDLRTLPVPDWVIWLTTGKVRNRLFFAAAALLGVYLLLCRAHLGPILRQLLSRDSRPLQVAVAMVVVAAALEDVFYHTRLNKFWEEGLEVIAYGLVLHAALSAYWLPGEPGSRHAAAASRTAFGRYLRLLAAAPCPGSPRPSPRS